MVKKIVLFRTNPGEVLQKVLTCFQNKTRESGYPCAILHKILVDIQLARMWYNVILPIVFHICFFICHSSISVIL